MTPQSAQALIDSAIPSAGPALVSARRDIAGILNIDYSSVAHVIDRGLLPQPLRLSRKCHKWDRAELRAALLRLLTGGEPMGGAA